MKILVFGDIHGNLPALELVLDTFSKEVDQIVCHGDVVNYGPWSNECVECLNSIDCITLKGNHEDAYINGFYPGSNPLVHKFFDKTYASFKHLEIIKKYDEVYHFQDYAVVHTINNSYYYPDSDLSKLDLERNHIIGHSHYPFIRTLENGKILANTGSVGQNRVNLSLANCIILDTAINSIEVKTLEFDTTVLITEMKLRDYHPDCISYYLSKM